MARAVCGCPRRQSKSRPPQTARVMSHYVRGARAREGCPVTAWPLGPNIPLGGFLIRGIRRLWRVCARTRARPAHDRYPRTTAYVVALGGTSQRSRARVHRSPDHTLLARQGSIEMMTACLDAAYLIESGEIPRPQPSTRMFPVNRSRSRRALWGRFWRIGWNLSWFRVFVRGAL
jgi:hypothetical protein